MNSFKNFTRQSIFQHWSDQLCLNSFKNFTRQSIFQHWSDQLCLNSFKNFYKAEHISTLKWLTMLEFNKAEHIFNTKVMNHAVKFLHTRGERVLLTHRVSKHLWLKLEFSQLYIASVIPKGITQETWAVYIIFSWEIKLPKVFNKRCVLFILFYCLKVLLYDHIFPIFFLRIEKLFTSRKNVTLCYTTTLQFYCV